MTRIEFTPLTIYRLLRRYVYDRRCESNRRQELGHQFIPSSRFEIHDQSHDEWCGNNRAYRRSLFLNYGMQEWKWLTILHLVFNMVLSHATQRKMHIYFRKKCDASHNIELEFEFNLEDNSNTTQPTFNQEEWFPFDETTETDRPLLSLRETKLLCQ